MAKRRGGGSKILTGIICFLLGFILAFAAIAGIICAVIFADLETIFGFVNIDNTDEEGNYVYVNTDEENGGVSNVYSLVAALAEYAGNYGDMTLGDLENLIPATSVIADSIVDLAVEYIDIDADELRDGLTTTKVNDLGDYVSDLVGSIEVSSLLEMLAPDLMGDDAAGVLITAIVYGKEADYVTTSDGDSPVYYDVYKYQSGVGYVRYTADEDGEYTIVDTTAGIKDSDALAGYLVPVYSDDDSSSGGTSAVSHSLTATTGTSQTIEYYYLYYYLSDGSAYVTDGDYTYITPSVNYSLYSEDAATLSGNYYKDAGGEKVVVTAVTLADLSDSQSITDSLNYVSITDLISSDGDDAVTAILGDYTIGDLLNGDIDFDTIELTSLLSAEPSNTVMAVILYDGIGGITETNGVWTCTYTDDEGNSYECTIELDSDGNISRIVYIDGEGEEAEVPATTVGGISDLMNDLELVVIMDPIAPDDDLMMYIFYGVTGITCDDSDNWTATYKIDDTTSVTAYIETSGSGDDITVTNVYYIDGEGNKVSTATTINGVSDVINKMQDEFEIAALMGDIDVTDDIMIYIAYKVTGVTESNGVYTGTYTDENGVEYGVTLAVEASSETDSDGNTIYYVTGVTYTDSGEALTGTTINGISDVIGDMQDEFEIASLMGDIDVEDDIMVYITYKVTGAHYNTTDDAWYGTYTDENDVEYTVTLAVKEGTDEKGETVYYVTGVTYTDDGSNLKGTTINSIGDVVSGLQDDLEIASLMGDIDADDAIMVYISYKVTGVTEANGVYTGIYTDDSGVKHGVTLAVEAGTDDEGKAVNYVTGVTYTDDGATLKGTTINSISDVISGLQDELEISSLLGDISTDDDILIYIAYSVTGVYQDNNGDWYGTYHVHDDTGDHTYTAILAVEASSETNGNGETVYNITGVSYTDGSDTYPVYGSTINDLNDVISNLQNDLEIAGLLGDIEVDNAILVYLTYSISGVYSTTDEKGNVTGWYGYIKLDSTSEKKTPVTIQYTTDDSGSEPVYYITGATYDDGGETVYLTGTTIKGISGQIDGIMEDLTLGELITIGDDNAFLKSLSDSTINGLSDAINSLSIQEVYYDSIYVTYKKVVADESSVTCSYTQIAFDSSDTFYTYDSNTNSYVLLSTTDPISSYNDLLDYSTTYYVKVAEAVMKQAISSYTETDYATTILFNAAYLYYTKDSDGNYTIVDYDESGNNLGKLTEDEFDAYTSEGIAVYTYGEVSGTWKLMLYSSGSEVAYSINSITDLMGNVTSNLGTATLNDLKEMKVITTDQSILDKPINNRDNTTLGDLTISEVIAYVADYILSTGD